MWGVDSLREALEGARGWARLGRTALRANLLVRPSAFGPRQLASAVLEGGTGVRSLHAVHAALDPNRLAFVDARRRCTYAQANAEIDALGTALRERWGVTARAPVAVCMENRVEYAVLWFALFRLGVPCVHLSRYGTAEELGALLLRSGASVVVASAQTRAVVRAAAQLYADCVVLDVDAAGADGYAALTRPVRRPAYGTAGQSHNVVYTSGTTGQPKGAVRNFGAFGPRTLLEILERLPMRRADTHLVVAPLYHSGGQVFTLLAAALGNTIVLESSFDPEATLRSLHVHDVDTVFMVPTMLRRLLELPQQAFARHRVSPRAVVCGAAPFLHPLRCAAIERFTARAVFDFYGATELGWVTLVDGPEMLRKPGSLGRPIPGQEIAVLDADGRRLPPDTVGRVYTRSAQRMQGYLADEDASSAIERSGWLTVDDLGRLDAEGSLFLTGRARDMVISGGVNVYPVEVERVLLEHPAIDDVAVVGVQDEQWGERLVACCVGRPAQDETLITWAKEQLAPYKVPRRWVWLDALPRNPTGKVLKRALVEILEA
ncbi:MAG: AMP-binding protein [Myxococcota bacterium]